MRRVVKNLGLIFLALLFLQLLTLPTYRTVKQRDPYRWPHKSGIISSAVAIRKHEGNTVKGFIIARDGLSATPFSAHEDSLKGPAAKQLAQFDKMTSRRKRLIWTIPINLILVIFGFIFSDFWEKRHPAPGHAIPVPEKTPEDEYKNSLNLKLEHARLKKRTHAEDEDEETDG